MKDFSIQDAKTTLESWLHRHHDLTVKSYETITEPSGEEGTRTRDVTVTLSNSDIRHYRVGERGGEDVSSI